MTQLRVTSTDGRTARLTGDTATTPGDVVAVGADPGTVLVQVVDDDHGSVLGALVEGRLAVEVAPFEDAPAEPAGPERLADLQAATAAGLTIGTWQGTGGAPARLRASGFNRHTFLCGQSGSGKTYALGVLLERLLLETGLPMAVLDPNADFVHLGQPRDDAPYDAAAGIRATDVRVLGPRPPAQPLRMRFTTMSRASQAAVLRLDPLADREEYHLFAQSFPHGQRMTGDVTAYVEGLLRGGAAERSLGQRIVNLGLTDWEAWAGEQQSAAEVVADGARATVLDLTGFTEPREAEAVCLDLVEALWARRLERRPMLLVVDEAHNVCPAEPEGVLARRLVDRFVQIAAEGRKYGLWLLLSTQRPSKVHQQVVSQCDNLLMMRMNSPADVADVARLFGFAPPSMVAAAPWFRQGEAVAAGRFVPCPTRLRMGDRVTVEGGADVAVPSAPPAPAPAPVSA